MVFGSATGSEYPSPAAEVQGGDKLRQTAAARGEGGCEARGSRRLAKAALRLQGKGKATV